ncbi:peptidylprolyl isomerase [Flagellimonas zhangzhouensis]|uniref:peptidylprolyl isomerase n=1 Tax=Flagellimonas zhangzhouensis TaxID=1073328 RepID=A0A1H2Y7A4_9FLAO|nr:peptidylprolyl isomerase [Allomuricauda zhangzhouensis]SDQ98784.1 peptidyl-prolyl cis-trans isomerase C [Allomuricauda zhangzhouensis]SDX00941.1 PPIC-type PPIASE domain-containing protein [Allomuricauda zhangzhouensis]
MKNFWKEPLLHFLLIGLLIFGYYSYVNKDIAPENAIVIDDSEYDYLLGLWKKQWQREPNNDDIKAFIDQYLRQEVFYKEALAMNLDHNDIIVKRRLSQKMEAVSNDLNAMIKAPSDEDLLLFYQQNEDLFQLPPTYTFQQVLFLEDEPDLEQELKAHKLSLTQTMEIPMKRKRKLSLSNSWNGATALDINKSFGKDFTLALDSLPLDQWIGPIESGYGQHLVFISDKIQSKTADFKEIKPYVEKEYEYQTELETQEQMYRDLLDKYQVKIISEKIPEAIKNSYSKS